MTQPADRPTGEREPPPQGSPHSKLELSPFDPFVKRVFPRIAAKVPLMITPNHVTLVGHAGSVAATVFLWLSASSPWWCPAAAVMLFAHWFTDTLDGPLARARGVSDLGHYLDHFGDIVGTVLVSLAIFLIPGSHLEIGATLVILYLLWMTHTQIKAEITDVNVIPPFGPTELHLVAIIALIAQPFVSYGHPVPGLGGLFESGGPIARILGFETGLTLVDGVGMVLAIGSGIGLAVETISFVRRMRWSDRLSI